MENSKELNELLEKKQAIILEIKAKQKEIDTWEPCVDDYEDQYCDSIDEMGDVVIGSLTYQASRVLKEIDPIAYSCGLNDFVDSLELNPDDLEEELEELEDQLIELDDEIERLKENNEDEAK